MHEYEQQELPALEITLKDRQGIDFPECELGRHIKGTNNRKYCHRKYLIMIIEAPGLTDSGFLP